MNDQQVLVEQYTSSTFHMAARQLVIRSDMYSSHISMLFVMCAHKDCRRSEHSVEGDSELGQRKDISSFTDDLVKRAIPNVAKFIHNKTYREGRHRILSSLSAVYAYLP